MKRTRDPCQGKHTIHEDKREHNRVNVTRLNKTEISSIEKEMNRRQCNLLFRILNAWLSVSTIRSINSLSDNKNAIKNRDVISVIKIFKMKNLYQAGQRISCVDNARITNFIERDGSRLPWKNQEEFEDYNRPRCKVSFERNKLLDSFSIKIFIGFSIKLDTIIELLIKNIEIGTIVISNYLKRNWYLCNKLFFLT